MIDRANPSRAIAEHMARLRYEDLSAATLHATKRSLLDALGVMLAASGLADDARAYRSHVANESGACRVIGSARRAGPAGAAFANGAVAHALDFGDTFDAGPAHPNAALVPALLALADADPRIGARDILTAMTVGADLACRLTLAPARPYEDGGWYPPPLANLIATAAASAKLIGLSADGICDAMGLALMQGTFPAEIKYDVASPMRGVREAFAARGGVDSALLARSGARAFVDPLGGRGGFFAIYGGGKAGEAFLDCLGKRFLGAEVSFKPWPACRGTHAYIEAALQLRERIGAQEIVLIEAEIGSVQRMLIEPLALKARPTSATEARFSIPYAVGAAFSDGAVTLDSFAPEKLADSAILSLAARVRPLVNPKWGRAEAASGALRVVLRDGSSIAASIPHALGDAQRPLTDEALVAKFLHCVQKSSLPRAQTWAYQLARDLMESEAPHPSKWLPAVD